MCMARYKLRFEDTENNREFKTNMKLKHMSARKRERRIRIGILKVV